MMTRDPVDVKLNTTMKTCDLGRNLKQGSTNKEFRVTLMSGERRILLDDANKINAVVMYNPRMEYDKLVYDGSYVLEPTDPVYDITKVAESINGEDFSLIKIPFHKGFVDYAGKCKLIINIVDDTGAEEVEIYTYSLSFDVDLTEGYFPQSPSNNLPSFSNLSDKVAKLETEAAAIEQKATSNEQALTTKADSDLANVGEFATAPEGSILIKKDGTLKHADIIVQGDRIEAPTKTLNVKNLETAPNTINIGPNISLSENGGFVENYTKTLGKYYIMLDYENDEDTGSKKPIYYERGAKEQQIIQSTDSVVMNNVITFRTGNPSFDRQLQAIYFNFVDPVKNLSFKVVVNGKDVAFYPSKYIFDTKQGGLNLSSGVQKVDFNPFFSNLVEYDVEFHLQADSPIRMLGNGTIPWYKLDLNRITRKNIALMDDLSGLETETAETIRNKLETLLGDERLPSSAIKDIPLETAVSIKTKLETLQGDERFDAASIKNIVNQITGENVKDKLETLSGDDRLDAGSIKNVVGQVTATHIKDSLETLSGDDRLDAGSIKNLPNPGSGVDEFKELSDTPSSYAGMAGKLLAMNAGEDKVEFVDLPSGQNTDFLEFKKRKELIIEMSSSDEFATGQFVTLTPKNDYTFKGNAISPTDKYKGDLIGVVSELLQNNTAKVALFAVIPTGVLSANTGDTAYLGFMPGGTVLEVKNTDVAFTNSYGECGAFGEEEAGQYKAIFDTNRLMSYYFGETAKDDDIEVINTSTATVFPDGKDVILYNVDLTSISAIAIQQLPDVQKSPRLRLYVDVHGDYEDVLRLTGYNGQSIGSNPTLELKGGHKNILFADVKNNRWIPFFVVDDFNTGISVTDKDDSEIAGVRSIKFNNGVVTSDGIGKIQVDIDGIGGDITDLAKKDLSNVTPQDFTNKLKADAAYKELAGRTTDLEAHEIKADFLAHYYEETRPVDIATLEGGYLSLRYQAQSNNQIIQQQLPDPSLGKILMIQFYKPKSIARASLEIMTNYPVNGSTETMVFYDSAFVGIFIPTVTGNYEFLSGEMLHESFISFEQREGESFEAKILKAENGIEFLEDKTDPNTPAVKMYGVYPIDGLVANVRSTNYNYCKGQYSFLPFGEYTGPEKAISMEKAAWSSNGYGGYEYNTNMFIKDDALIDMDSSIKVIPNTFPLDQTTATITFALGKLKDGVDGSEEGHYDIISTDTVGITKDQDAFYFQFKNHDLEMHRGEQFTLMWKSDSSSDTVAYTEGTDSDDLITNRINYRKFPEDKSGEIEELKWLNSGYMALHAGNDNHNFNSYVHFTKPYLGTPQETLNGTGVIVVKVIMNGKCLKDNGSAKISIVPKGGDSSHPLTNISGNPLSVMRDYNTNDDLKYLEILMAYHFDEPTTFEVYIEADIGSTNNVEVTNDSAICVQPITKNGIIGLPMLAYQHFTDQNISYRAGSLGEIKNINELFGKYELSIPQSSTMKELTNGIYINPISKCIVNSDGNNLGFNLGSDNAELKATLNMFFSDDDLQVVKGNTANVSGSITSANGNYDIALVKHTGDAGADDKQIVNDVVSGTPSLNTGWTIEKSWKVTSFDATSGEQKINYTMNVDAVSNAYALVVIPTTGGTFEPYHILISELKVSANNIPYFQLESKNLIGERLITGGLRGITTNIASSAPITHRTVAQPFIMSDAVSGTTAIHTELLDDDVFEKYFNIRDAGVPYVAAANHLTFTNNYDNQTTINIFWAVDNIKVDSTTKVVTVPANTSKIVSMPNYERTSAKAGERIRLMYLIGTQGSEGLHQQGGIEEIIETDYTIDAIIKKLRQIEVTDNAYSTGTRLSLDNSFDGNNPSVSARSDA